MVGARRPVPHCKINRMLLLRESVETERCEGNNFLLILRTGRFGAAGSR
jgi:hypothetical protein